MQAKLRILILIVKMQELRIQTDKMIHFKVFSKANHSHHASLKSFLRRTGIAANESLENFKYTGQRLSLVLGLEFCL